MAGDASLTTVTHVIVVSIKSTNTHGIQSQKTISEILLYEILVFEAGVVLKKAFQFKPPLAPSLIFVLNSLSKHIMLK